MKALTKIIIITLALIISWGGHTLTGQINVGVSGTPSVVNAYYPVTAISGNTITVGAGTGIAHSLAANDRVLLIQMTGNTGANGGKFEYAKVTSVAGSSVTVDLINRAYSPATEKVQLVWVPYDPVGITIIANILAMDWNGTTGGIVSLLTPGTLTMNGSILADGAGFRYADYNNAITGSNVFFGGGGAGGGDTGGGSGIHGSGGGGGGYGSGGKGGRLSSGYGQDGTYIGGNSVPTTIYSTGGGGGGGGVGGGGGGGGGAEGGGGGGGASLTNAGCGGSVGSATGGPGSENNMGGSSGTPHWEGAGGGGGGAYIGGGGGAGLGDSNNYGLTGGVLGSSGGNGGLGSYPYFDGGNGGGITPVTGYPSFHNYFSCDNISGNCADPRAWMGGGAQMDVRGGGIVLVYADNIVANNRTMRVHFIFSQINKKEVLTLR